MAMKFLFFAQCADWMQRREMTVSITGPAVLKDILAGREDLSPILKHQQILKVSRNHDFIDLNTEVYDNDEIGFLPPVSGG